MSLHDQTVESLLESIGARTPSPGGGAVASLVGALAAALGRMALAYSINRRCNDEQRRDLQGTVDHLVAIGRQMLDLAQRDALAYAEVDRLQRLAPDDPQRVVQWDAAVRAAIDAPMAVIEASCGLAGLLCDAAEQCTRGLLSDLAIAALLASAAAQSGAWNVRVNLPLLASDKDRRRLEDRLSERVVLASAAAYRAEATCRRRLA